MKTILINNLRLFFKDKKAVILTFLLPVGLTSLFMFIFGGNVKEGERGMSAMDIGICDLVQDNASQKLVADLDSNKSYIVKMFADSAELRDEVHKGNTNAGIIISKSKTGEQEFTLYLDGAREVENAMLKPMLGLQLMGSGNKSMKNFIAKKIKIDFPDFNDEDMARFDKNFESFKPEEFEKISDESIHTIVIKPENGINPGAIQAISGTALMTLLFAVVGMGAGIIEEKERGTLRRILISPIRPMEFMFAKFFSSVIIGCAQLFFTLLFANIVFDFPVFSNPLAIVLLIFSTAMACSAFGMLLAGIAESRKQIESLSTIVVLLMSLLGGSMIPAFVMPQMMQNFSMITINYWAGEGFFDIYYRNIEFSHFIIKIGVLLLYCSILLSLAYFFFNRKLKRIF